MPKHVTPALSRLTYHAKRRAIYLNLEIDTHKAITMVAYSRYRSLSWDRTNLQLHYRVQYLCHHRFWIYPTWVAQRQHCAFWAYHANYYVWIASGSPGYCDRLVYPPSDHEAYDVHRQLPSNITYLSDAPIPVCSSALSCHLITYP